MHVVPPHRRVKIIPAGSIICSCTSHSRAWETAKPSRRVPRLSGSQSMPQRKMQVIRHDFVEKKTRQKVWISQGMWRLGDVSPILIRRQISCLVWKGAHSPPHIILATERVTARSSILPTARRQPTFDLLGLESLSLLGRKAAGIRIEPIR